MTDLPDPLTVPYSRHVLDDRAGLIEALRLVTKTLRHLEDIDGARNALVSLTAHLAVAAADDDNAEAYRRRIACARIGALQKMRATESAA